MGELLLALLAIIFLPAAGMMPSRRPTADLWERRPRHGSSGARPHRRQRAAAGSRSCSRRLEANPAELLRHQLRLTMLSKTPQESLRTVQRGGRSTTVFSNSDLAPPSSIPIQPIRRIRSSWSETLRLSVFPYSSKERIPVMSYASCVVIGLPRTARAMSDLLQLGSCPVGLP